MCTRQVETYFQYTVLINPISSTLLSVRPEAPSGNLVWPPLSPHPPSAWLPMESLWQNWRVTTSCARRRSAPLRSSFVPLRSGTSSPARVGSEPTPSWCGSSFWWVVRGGRGGRTHVRGVLLEASPALSGFCADSCCQIAALAARQTSQDRHMGATLYVPEMLWKMTFKSI